MKAVLEAIVNPLREALKSVCKEGLTKSYFI